MKISIKKFRKQRTQIAHLADLNRDSNPIISYTQKRQNPCHSKGFSHCAREESRTPTSFTSQASETCASTNFATRAEVEMLRITLPRRRMV